MGKTIVYQMLPRLWGNKCMNPVRNGSLEENGSGKFGDVDAPTLSYLRDCLGVTHGTPGSSAMPPPSPSPDARLRYRV